MEIIVCVSRWKHFASLKQHKVLHKLVNYWKLLWKQRHLHLEDALEVS